MQFTADVKEALLDELETQRRQAGIEVQKAHVERIERKRRRAAGAPGQRREPVRALRVIIAIGRSGNYRALGCAGEKLDKVFHRLYDPKEYAGQERAGGRRRRLGAGVGDRAGAGGRGGDAQLSRQGIRAPQARQRRQAAARCERDPDANVAVERAVVGAGEHGDDPQHGAGQARRPSRVHARPQVKEIRADARRCSPTATARR